MHVTSEMWANYPNFSESEFACKHTGKHGMQRVFMDRLQRLRTAYGKPMKVNSGYRHPTHPIEAAKGHSRGEHTKGMCADIAVTSSAERFTLIKLAMEHGFTRIGFHRGFLHLGLGTPDLPNNVFWDY